MSQVIQSSQIRWVQVAKILISVLSVMALGIVAVGIVQVNVGMWNEYDFLVALNATIGNINWMLFRFWLGLILIIGFLNSNSPVSQKQWWAYVLLMTMPIVMISIAVVADLRTFDGFTQSVSLLLFENYLLFYVSDFSESSWKSNITILGGVLYIICLFIGLIELVRSYKEIPWLNIHISSRVLLWVAILLIMVDVIIAVIVMSLFGFTDWEKWYAIQSLSFVPWTTTGIMCMLMVRMWFLRFDRDTWVLYCVSATLGFLSSLIYHFVQLKIDALVETDYAKLDWWYIGAFIMAIIVSSSVLKWPDLSIPSLLVPVRIVQNPADQDDKQIPSVSKDASIIENLERLEGLLNRGLIDEAEYTELKRNLLKRDRVD
jgi:hypothetical protein